jgi:predicted dehydrogenase
MATPHTINVGVIGLGFMGRTHAAAYEAAARDGLPCRLSAVCDRSPERLAGQDRGAGNIVTGRESTGFDLSRVRAYANPDALLADPGIHLVSICTYTDTHADLAARALAAGKHVLVEKPVALRSAEVRRLADAARKAGRICMPAMCMRFWPGWDWLHDRVMDGSFGPVRSAAFQRMGAGPGWAADFYRDPRRSGGAMFDLHVHDADFIHWCFGRPRSVFCAGSAEHFTTCFRFDGGPLHVMAEGAWDLPQAAGFRMRYVVVFERATADWELGRTPALLVHQAEGSEPVPLPLGAGYEGEVRHVVMAVANGSAEVRATLDDAAAVTETLEAAVRSRESGRPVDLFV